MGFSERFRIFILKRLVFDKSYVFAHLRIQRLSKIDLQGGFVNIFSTKPHQKTTPDSLEASELCENLEIRLKQMGFFEHYNENKAHVFYT